MIGTRILEEDIDLDTEGHLSSGGNVVQAYGILVISADRNFVFGNLSQRAGVLSISKEVLESLRAAGGIDVGVHQRTQVAGSTGLPAALYTLWHLTARHSSHQAVILAGRHAQQPKLAYPSPFTLLGRYVRH